MNMKKSSQLSNAVGVSDEWTETTARSTSNSSQTKTISTPWKLLCRASFSCLHITTCLSHKNTVYPLKASNGWNTCEKVVTGIFHAAPTRHSKAHAEPTVEMPAFNLSPLQNNSLHSSTLCAYLRLTTRPSKVALVSTLSHQLIFIPFCHRCAFFGAHSQPMRRSKAAMSASRRSPHNGCQVPSLLFHFLSVTCMHSSLTTGHSNAATPFQSLGLHISCILWAPKRFTKG